MARTILITLAVLASAFLVFAATKPGEYHAFIVTHTMSGSRTRPIRLNRFANFSPSVHEEISSSILRGLVPIP